ncbi:MAG TPA: peptidoglycan bridge formation glycyltransferase FemA/FemB family protein [bacterium]|nr:peptidoglycan bridge formation glycyltransferase FemA/FemB family protein [bacterium]
MIEVKLVDSRDVWESIESKELLQSWYWGEFLQSMGRKVWRIGVFDDGKLIGQAETVLIPGRIRRYLYVLAGPYVIGQETYKCPYQKSDVYKSNYWPIAIPRETYRELLEKLREYLMKLGKDENCSHVRIEPRLLDTPENNQLLTDSLYKRSPIFIQCPDLWILDISENSENLMRNMRKDVREGIRRGKRKGIFVKSSLNISETDSEEFFNTYYNLLVETSERTGMILESREYYYNQYRTLTKYGKGVIYTAYNKQKPVAALFVAYSSDTLYTLHSGTPNLPNSEICNAPKILKWRAILDAKEKNLKYLNFYGISPQGVRRYLEDERIEISDNLKGEKSEWDGLTKVKKGFGGYALKLINPYDIKINYKYDMIRVMEKASEYWKKPYAKILNYFNRN